MGETMPTNAERAFARGIGRPIHVRGHEPCIGLLDLFFPDRSQKNEAEEAVAVAIRLCGGCDRAFECRSKARARKETDGVWGGLDFYRLAANRKQKKVSA
jgi:hypothetical protein